MHDAISVKISSLKFRWPGSSEFQLSIPEFTVAKGERIFLQGASGSGKSTLLSLLGGVLLPQQGRIRLFRARAHPAFSIQRDRFRADHLGFLFQQFNLVPYLSVLENVLLPCRFSKLRRKRAQQTGASLEQNAIELLSRLGIDSVKFKQRVTELSVGQQQRVAAARALIGQPELIIADETTSALDSDRQNAFLDLLLEQCANGATTVLFVSHDQRLAGHFDRRLQMSEVGLISTAPGSAESI